jgi:hypothetical protein
MKIIEIQDNFNPAKVWVIKKTKCGHYYLNQKIWGRLFYHSFQRTTKKWLYELKLI